jgi:hypothetical protein
MPFARREVSRNLGSPVSFYLFTFGNIATQQFAYTDAEQIITNPNTGITYEPLAIERSSIATTGTLDKSQITIKMPRDAGIATRFTTWPSTQPIRLEIRQGHDEDTNILPVWIGRVSAIGREDDMCVLSGDPVSSALRRSGLRRPYSIGCPRIVYNASTGCPASEAAGTVTATLASVAGNKLTFASGWNGAKPFAKFAEGFVYWPNDLGLQERRTILSATATEVTLSGLPRDLIAGASVSLVLGCNRTMTDCETLHNVIQSFGGNPFIPVKNPVSSRNLYN